MLLLRDADVFAPEPLGRNDVLLGGGRVLALGRRLERPSSWPVDELDLDGRALVPGFVDAHVHLGGGGGEGGPHTRVPALHAGALAHAGITSCVALLGTDGTTRTMADLVARVLGLRAEGLSAWCWTGSYEVPVRTLTGSVRSDLVFVDPILGVGELAISDHRSSQPTFDELLRVAADVHAGGMMADKAGVLHLHLGDGARGLELVRAALTRTELPASVFHPTHVNRNARLFSEAQSLAIEHGCTIDVTAFPDEDLGDAIAADEAIAVCVRAGVPLDRITCSSDGGGCMPRFGPDGHMEGMGVGRPSTLVDAFRRLIARGMTLPDALRPFTSNVARMLRLRDKGRIAVGGDADLIALDREHRPWHVLARGEPWVREGAPVRRGTFEGA
jgi:beta-aspartyl-dipeptidase (metallo-type)